MFDGLLNNLLIVVILAIILLVILIALPSSKRRKAAFYTAEEQRRRQADSQPVPSSSPNPALSPSPYDEIQAAIARNPKSAGLRAEYADTANYTLLELSDYLFGKDPLTFVSFDLETTGLSNNNDEIVEIGAVRVVNGEITDRYHQLVKPENGISSSASSVNHITDDMLTSAPRLYEILPDFLAFVGSDVLVAHNARFDSGFLSMACLRYRLKYPLKYFDSRSLSYFWPDLPNRKLSTFLSAAGIENPESHRALPDAEALARLMIVAMNKEFNLPLPEGYEYTYSNEHFTGTVDVVDSKLAKKRFVLTGKMDGCERCDFEKMIASHGGRCTQKISSATDYLVVGSFPGLPKNYVSSTVLYARKVIAEGGKLQIISCADVMNMLEEA